MFPSVGRRYPSGIAPYLPSRRSLPVQFALIGCFFLAGTCIASAQSAPRVVKFAPGETATILKGTIKARNDARYLIDAASGQVIHALFQSSSKACYFNVTENGSGSADHIGSISGNEFGKNLTQAGSYRFDIYLARSGARRNRICRYQLTIELTGAPGGTSPGQSDVMMRDLCKGAAAPMYGVQPRSIVLKPRINSVPAGGFTINGTVNKGSEGKKTMRCIFKPDRTLDRVMATTADGE